LERGDLIKEEFEGMKSEKRYVYCNVKIRKAAKNRKEYSLSATLQNLSGLSLIAF